MKLNLKKIKLNQIVLFVAVVLVMVWIIRRRQVEKLEGEEEEMSIDDLINYVNDTKDLSENPFYVAAMLSDKITADQEANLVALASENNRKSVLTLLKSLQ
jgi:hypothetical protein